MSVIFEESSVTMDDLLGHESKEVAVVKKGSIVQGKVVIINKEEESVVIGLGTKSEGRLSLKEFDEEPKVGQEVEAIVKNIDKDTGLLNLSKSELERQRGWRIIEEAFENELPITGVVVRTMAKGYLVNVENINLFLPHSHVGTLSSASHFRGRKPDILNSTFSFYILELNPKRKTGVISRKKYQDEQNTQKWSELIESVNIGDVIEGKPIKHTQVGIFVEVKGVLGLLHRSNISWERNANVKEVVKIDEKMSFRVLEIDPENNRLTLGLKQLTENPWNKVEERFTKGQVVKGLITFTANFGAFVDLGEGIEGLLHTSEMSWTRKVNHAKEIVKSGNEIEVKILEIKKDEKRISLGLRQLMKNPWDDIHNVLKVGDVIKANIKDITPFGIFVGITDEIDGLVRREDINWDNPLPDPKKLYKRGEEVEFKIKQINLEEKKIECSIRHLLPNPYSDLRKKYPRGALIKGQVSGIAEFGIFVKFDNIFEGLVHVNALPQEHSASPKNHYNKGDEVQCVLRSVDTEKKKISLSIRDVEGALERKDIEKYLGSNKDVPTTDSPFSGLKNFVFPESI